MRNILGAALLGVALLAGAAWGADGDVVNVRAFHQGGDDYTEAFRAAVAEAAKRSRPLYVPAGTYRLSGTVTISGVPEIFGRGYPVLQMKDPERDILFSEHAWRTRISGLCFEGGRDQLALGNNNIDKGMIHIVNCRFKNAAGAGIRFLRRTKGETASTFCLVEQGMFEYCRQALIAVSDQVHFKDSWITTVRTNPGNLAVIENHGTLICSNILGVPYVVADDLRWIDNHGLNLTCRNFRFGGEGGGFTPVVNFAKYRPGLFGPTVVLEDCYVGAIGNATRQAAVYCEEIPNRIAIRDCHVAGVSPVKLRPDLKLDGYFDEARAGMITLDVLNNSGEFMALPEGLAEAAAAAGTKARSRGDAQLSPAETAARLADAVAKAKALPPLEGAAVMRYERKTDGHRQQTDPAAYTAITMQTHRWHADDMLDGTTDPCGDYLALGDAGGRTVLFNRMDQHSYPHVVVENVAVDLDDMPVLSFRLRDMGCRGGHLAVKLRNRADGKVVTLMENYLDESQWQYYAYDLRDALRQAHGRADVDLKIYLCGTRIYHATGDGNYVNLEKGDYFVLDFLRLEKANHE